jgi:phage terminase small subunit
LPRKSSAELTQFPRVDVTRPTYLKTPPDLPATLRNIVADLIASQKPGHFRRGDEALLEQFAQAIVLGRQAYERIEAEGPVIDGRSSPWLVVLEKAHRSVVALSGRLRLAPQMRASSRTAGRSQPTGYYGAVPWTRE